MHSGIFIYEEAYDWYADYGGTGNAQAANDQVMPTAADDDGDANQGGTNISAGIKFQKISTRFVKALC